MKNKYLGSSFDDFLEEDGLRAETEAAAIKRVIAHRIEMEMKRANLLWLRKCTPAALLWIGSLTLPTFLSLCKHWNALLLHWEKTSK